jgi:dTDP-4-dehydrorhamnose 3,5-epimerase
MLVRSTAIEAVKIVIPKAFTDSRGTFSETHNKAHLAESGIEFEFVQDNQSFSLRAGTVRGLHFQSFPKAQNKLVRVLRGRALDVAVDLRRGSKTYGQWVAEELTAENRKQMLVPIGFAHGFCTLEPNTEVFYKVTEYYSPENDFGVAWNDPQLAINWPVASAEAILSDRDRNQPDFSSLPAYFE